MMHTRLIAATLALVGAACTDSTEPGSTVVPDAISLTASQLRSLDSTAQVIAAANPADADLRALADSTLTALSSGVQARRLPVTTNLTTAPLYFVGIHRVFDRAGASSATWTLVGFDDPAHLTRLFEVGGFAQNGSATAPSSVSGTIGVAGNIGNGIMLQVGNGGTVTEWRANGGTASFASDAAGAACPNFTNTARVTCTLETMHVSFNVTGATTAGTSGAPLTAALPATADVQAMRLTYAP